MLALNEWGFTAVLFLVYHFVASVVLFGINIGTLDSTLLGLSAADAGLVGCITITSAVMFKLKAEYFGDYKLAFNTDTLSQYHYWLVLGGRIILACAIVALNSMSYVGFICAGIPLIGIVYLVIKRPYTLLYNNIRAALNELIMLVVLSIYGYYRVLVGPSAQDTLSVFIMPIVIVGLLVVCIIINSVFMLKYWCDKRSLTTSEAKEQE